MFRQTAGMAIFLRDVGFHGIVLDAILDYGNPNWQTVYDLVADGIRTGVVQPLQTSVYDHDDIENAFRFMAQGKHIGKVVIKVINNLQFVNHLLRWKSTIVTFLWQNFFKELFVSVRFF
jgi:hypothetical protein